MRELLRASHIKPWAHCETDAERLDVHNGILLAPHFDAAFDLGFITIENNGQVVVSEVLPFEARQCLHLDKPIQIDGLHERHGRYLPWHRAKVFKQSRGPRSV